MDEMTNTEVHDDYQIKAGLAPDPRWTRIDRIRWHLRDNDYTVGTRFSTASVVELIPELSTKDVYNSLFHMATNTGELEMDNGVFRVIAIKPPTERIQAPKPTVTAKPKKKKARVKARAKDGLLERVGKVGNRIVVVDRSTQQVYALTELK